MRTQQIDDEDDFDLLAASAKPVEGWRLLEALLAKGRQEGIGLTEVAKKIGISRSYLFSLRYGQRKVPSLGRGALDKCAQFLGVPVTSVLLMAEVMQPTDFVAGPSERARQEVQRALEFFAGDPDWCGFIPADWRSWSPQLQVMTVLLYQKASGLQLLPSLFDARAAVAAFNESSL
jgi:transcriptional regulator with XRE-family HTH domain